MNRCTYALARCPRRLPFLATVVFASGVSLSCGDKGVVQPEIDAAESPVPGLVISDPRPASTSVAVVGEAPHFAQAANVVWISVVPGTFQRATLVEVANRSQRTAALSVVVSDGGFDPVSVPANTGDTLDVTVWHDDGTKDPLVIKVPSKRPPTVVRSSPPRGRTAVALNVAIGIVFTEPINPETVNTSSVRLLRDGRSVSGRLSVSADGWEVQFVPDAPLAASTTYEFTLTRDLKDLSGDALDAVYSGTFTTGNDRCGDTRACDPSLVNVITGHVWNNSAAGRAPLYGATIAAWFQPENGNGYLVEGSITDAAGGFSLGPFSNGILQIRADRIGFDQPCGVRLDLTGSGGNVDVDLRLSREADMASVPKPRMWGATGYFVEEKPQSFLLITVPGVRVQLESPDGFVAARTTSDKDGHYAICNIPRLKPATVRAVAAGFKEFVKAFTISDESLLALTDLFYDIYIEK